MLESRSRLSAGFFAARLALLALAVQLVLSFAHMHLLPPQMLVQQAVALSASDNGTAVPEDCAICATIAAFAAADLPPPIAVLRPAGQGEPMLPWVVRAGIPPESFRHFNSRAPPNA